MQTAHTFTPLHTHIHTHPWMLSGTQFTTYIANFLLLLLPMIRNTMAENDAASKICQGLKIRGGQDCAPSRKSQGRICALFQISSWGLGLPTCLSFYFPAIFKSVSSSLQTLPHHHLLPNTDYFSASFPTCEDTCSYTGPPE